MRKRKRLSHEWQLLPLEILRCVNDFFHFADNLIVGVCKNWSQRLIPSSLRCHGESAYPLAPTFCFVWCDKVFCEVPNRRNEMSIYQRTQAGLITLPGVRWQFASPADEQTRILSVMGNRIILFHKCYEIEKWKIWVISESGTTETNCALDAWPFDSTPCIASNGTLGFAAFDNEIHCVDSKGGQVAVRHDSGQAVLISAREDNTFVTVTTKNPKIIRLFWLHQKRILLLRMFDVSHLLFGEVRSVAISQRHFVVRTDRNVSFNFEGDCIQKGKSRVHSSNVPSWICFSRSCQYMENPLLILLGEPYVLPSFPRLSFWRNTLYYGSNSSRKAVKMRIKHMHLSPQNPISLDAGLAK